MAKGERYPDPNNRRDGPYPHAHDQSHDHDANEEQGDDVTRQLLNAANASGNNASGNDMTGASVGPSMDPIYTQPQQYNPAHFGHTQPAYSQYGGAQLAPQAPMGAAPVASMTMGPPPVPASAGGTPVQAAAAQTPNTEEHTGRRATKSSRACDECRRKKVRCDKDPITDEPCSNCKKTSGVVCAFSREPQKRGPNKGYIRELTDRVTSVEKILKPEGAAGSPTPAAGPSGFTRKRSADLAGLDPHPYAARAARGIGFGEAADLNVAANGIPVPRLPNAGGRQPEVLTNDVAFPTPYERGILEQYRQKLHPSFPLFSADSDKIEILVTHCSSQQRDALFQAVEAMIIPLVEGDDNVMTRHGAASNAWEHYSKSKDAENHKHRHYATNVVLLHALACLIVAFESLGDFQAGDDTWSSIGPFYGEARDIFAHIKINEGQLALLGDDELNQEFFAAARRVWWIFVTLDTFKAMGEATTPFLPKPRELVEGDRDALGPTLSEIAGVSRLCHRLLSDLNEAKGSQTKLRNDLDMYEDMLNILSDKTSAEARRAVRCVQAHVRLFIRRLELAFRNGTIKSQKGKERSNGVAQVATGSGVVSQLQDSVRLYHDVYQGSYPFSPLFSHFMALAILVAKELQLMGVGPTHPHMASLDVISATLSTVQDDRLDSEWVQAQRNAVDKLRADQSDGMAVDIANEWPLDILDGYMNVFAAGL